MRPREDRSKLLTLLSTPRYVPLTEIMALLGLPRSSSQQVIARLRQRGVGIECLVGVGYRRNPAADVLPTQNVRPSQTPRWHEPLSLDTFGGYLGHLRVKAGLSQSALAGLACVSPSYISLFEVGRRRPTQNVAACLCAAMDLSGLERDQLTIRAGYAPPSLSWLSSERLNAILTLANEEAA